MNVMGDNRRCVREGKRAVAWNHPLASELLDELNAAGMLVAGARQQRGLIRLSTKGQSNDGS